MMRLDLVLAGTLVVQLGLSALTWTSGTGQSAPAAKLVDLDREALTRIEVTESGPDAASVVLAKQGEAWVLADHGNYPTDPEKVSKLLDGLLDVQVRAPIATQATSHASLKVDSADFDKRVTLGAGDKAVALVVGAGGKNAHVRRDGEDEVYRAVGLSPWSIGTRTSQYYATTYLEVDTASVSTLAIQGPDQDLSLVRDGETWLYQGEPARASEVEGLLKKLATVRISDLPKEPEFDPAVTVSWTLEQDGASIEGSLLFSGEVDGKHLARASASEHTVLVGSYTVAPFLEASEATLVGE